MIRDGLTLKGKRVMVHQRNIDRVGYEEDFFSSIASMVAAYYATGDASVFRFLRDPFALSLVLNDDIISVKIPEATEPAAEPEVLCREVYEAFVGGDVCGIWDRLTEQERLIAELILKNTLKLPKEEILKHIAKAIGADINSTLLTWAIQPDPEAISFALGSHLATTELITPVMGLPIRFPSYSAKLTKIRYPCISFTPVGDRIVIMKEEDKVYVFGADGKDYMLDLPKNILEVAGTWCIEAYAKDGEIKVSDLLCLHDVWLTGRPLSERLLKLWRFFEWGIEYQTHYHPPKVWDKQAIIRNLNSPWDPRREDSHIIPVAVLDSCVLKVGNLKGRHTNTFLLSKDGKPVFRLPIWLASKEEEVGDLVEVSMDGMINRIIDPGIAVSTFKEIEAVWGVWRKSTTSIPYCKWGEFYDVSEDKRRTPNGF